MTRLTAAAVLLCVATLAAPAAAIEGLREVRSAVVADIVDGDTVVLDDGTEVRLVGVQAPKLPLGRAGFETQPLAPEAQAAMRELALGQRVTLYHGGQPVDRWSRTLAHLRDEAGRRLQRKMLSRGL
jgi:endonuclease YncB( thermonuclease family)